MSEDDPKPWLAHYDDHVSPEIRIPEKTYVDLLEEGLTHSPERPALYYMGKMLTFAELDALSRNFASFLNRNGYGPGDVVGIDLPNIPEYPIALAGALRAGCAVTGISPLLTPKEMAYQINDSGAGCIVIMDALFEERLLKIQNSIPNVKHILLANVGTYLPAIKRILGNLLKKIPSGKLVPIPGKEVMLFQNIVSEPVAASHQIKITPEDTCLIQYTGGTTGLPKGTVLTHRNLVANNIHAKEWTGFEIGKDILCSGFPFFHLAGLAFGMLALCTANTQCLIPDPRNTKHICKEIASKKPTVMAYVPTLYHMLMDNPSFKTLDFSSLKICVSGAAPFSVEGIHAIESIIGKGKIMEVYGMTESSPLLTMNPIHGKKKIGSVGIPIQNTMIKLVDLEGGTREVHPGEEGELIARGPQIMKGYHNKPEETGKTLKEFQNKTWLYTGDIARMDADGYLYIVDRSKDMLIVGGYKVFSREVEETLYQFPDIEFCAIVGVKDEKRPGNDIVKAVIQLTKKAGKKDVQAFKQELTQYCRDNMAPYKVPKVIEIVDAIPLTAVGKVDKKALR
ncbi:MAG: AMP-dependent synthetase [Desulfobacteraceae bacterium]|nr:MAG: AMP-dependent synthetase [Desulfobacteraceae bacterium]